MRKHFLWEVYLIKKNGRVTQSYLQKSDNSEVRSDNHTGFIDNEEFSIDTKLGNHFNPGQSSHLNKPNQEAFDLQTYEKFLLFLKFQEMIDKYDTWIVLLSAVLCVKFNLYLWEICILKIPLHHFKNLSSIYL